MISHDTTQQSHDFSFEGIFAPLIAAHCVDITLEDKVKIRTNTSKPRSSSQCRVRYFQHIRVKL